jgi:hypothetical protein
LPLVPIWWLGTCCWLSRARGEQPRNAPLPQRAAA